MEPFRVTQQLSHHRSSRIGIGVVPDAPAHQLKKQGQQLERLSGWPVDGSALVSRIALLGQKPIAHEGFEAIAENVARDLFFGRQELAKVTFVPQQNVA